ncbi:restriction endonuclease subunit S [Candidatus Enterococcus courvalinii]|uniref:Restriction endonuclease subunit S n=1 Tax=Candidatus Enterococcus courvalinii TaxID=2815329 RepID=A0ABS3HXX6_9ENTE|nr:restriction endonuclease subunit S [Enterococcus sp. MSG2901]MBO0481323.1 restriction endonuclease subunit S [Enterococcus sp. MSG2901]
MKDERKNTPVIRFAGFFDAWELRKLGEVAEIVGGGTPSTGNPEYWGRDIDWYSPAEIGDQDYVSGSQKKITHLGLQKSSAKILPAGTVLFTSRAGIGSTAILAKEGATNQGFQSILPRKNVLDSYFIYSRTGELKRYGEVTGAGSTFVEVSGKQMAQMPICIPDIKEQEQIGSFFKQLDGTITLHQRKIEAIQQIKKGFLQQMFPTNEESVPRGRFADFEEKWEQRKLSELAESFEYGLNATSTDYNGENKYLRITDIDDNSREFIQDGLTSPDIDLSSADNYKLQKGDVLFARTGASVGKTYRYQEKDGLVYYAGFLIRARIKPEFDSDFVFQNTLTDRYNNFIRITSQRSGQPGVNAKEYGDFQISVPNFDEQKKIGKFFKSIDDLFTLHQDQLNKLKTVKKAYLQNMFI